MRFKTFSMVLVLFSAMLGSVLAENYEYAMIKWDGPDKLAIIYPDRAEVVRVFKHAKPPADISEEEFCLTWGANQLGKEGWEPVNLNSRRILFRRAPKT
jgi:hypothetical protein